MRKLKVPPVRSWLCGETWLFIGCLATFFLVALWFTLATRNNGYSGPSVDQMLRDAQHAQLVQARKNATECVGQSGKVVVISHDASCIVDGVVVAKWTTPDGNS